MYIKNSFILSTVFILVSGFFLLTTAETGYAQPISDCCFANGGTGCDDQACEDLICAQDSFCCDVEWDGICAGLANNQCEVCIPDFAINLEPLEATNEVFTDHTVTATVLQDGIPAAGILVDFEVISGPNAGESSDPNSGECTPNDDCTTDANGQVSWTYSSDLLGIDTIVASAENVQSNNVEKEWINIRNIPTLSEWGMISTAAVLGLIGVFYLFSRKRRALS